MNLPKWVNTEVGGGSGRSYGYSWAGGDGDGYGSYGFAWRRGHGHGDLDGMDIVQCSSCTLKWPKYITLRETL